MKTKIKIKRRKTRPVRVGNVTIGGNAPISIQSMCKTFTHDVKATVEQIHELERAGCEIIRVAVPDMRSADALPNIKKQISIPLVADIHFNYKLALKALFVDKLRINPGNIGSREKVKMVVKEAKDRQIPIRIGVNAGSLEKDLLKKYRYATPEAMVESALKHVKILEDLDFFDIVISLKASDVLRTVKAYELMSERRDYPLHLGITEAGIVKFGTIKSSVGIGYLLLQGIGDTIRVSLTGSPVEEVFVGYEILRSLGLREYGVNLISCPTCGRAEIDTVSIANEVDKRLQMMRNKIKKPITVAVMGCLPKGVPIITNPKFKSIENIKVNDYVLTHSCKFQKVKQTFVRYYKGDLIEIKPRGFPPFLVTPEHPIRVISRRYISRGKQKFVAVSRSFNRKPQWIEASMLSKKWILTYPIINEEKDVKIYKNIKVDEDFLTLCGYYLGKGTWDKNDKPYQIHFDFHIKKKHCSLKLVRILNKYGINARTYTHSSRNIVSVYTSSFSLGSTLLELFGRKSKEKHMPQWFLTLPRKKQVHLLKALWEGDGYIGKIKNYWRASYSTISPLLAFQVHQFLLRQGIAAMLTINARQGYQKSYRVIVTGKYYLRRFFRMMGLDINLDIKLNNVSERQYITVDDNFLYTPIFRINRIPYEGKVYNLEVDQDHSYVTFGASLHNCIVNGPGEAKEADVGVAGGKGKGAIFRKGKVIKIVNEKEIVDVLLDEVFAVLHDKK